VGDPCIDWVAVIIAAVIVLACVALLIYVTCLT
jgi:hypothetical protein